MTINKVIVPAALALFALTQPGFGQQAAPAPAAPAPAAAEEESLDSLIPGTVAGTVNFTSDYMFRGISQTDNDPAAQASLEYSIDVDAGPTTVTPYVGVWGSNVDFNDGDAATVEFDISFGLRGAVPVAGQEIGWNLGGIFYYYPGAGRVNGASSNYNYWEIPVALTYSPIEEVTFGVSYFYSPDYFAATGHAHYLNGKISYSPDVPYIEPTLFAAFGRQWIEDAKDYNDWTLGLTVPIKGVGLTFQYTDTNLTQAQLGGSKLSDSRFVFSIGYAF